MKWTAVVCVCLSFCVYLTRDQQEREFSEYQIRYFMNLSEFDGVLDDLELKQDQQTNIRRIVSSKQRKERAERDRILGDAEIGREYRIIANLDDEVKEFKAELTSDQLARFQQLSYQHFLRSRGQRSPESLIRKDLYDALEVSDSQASLIDGIPTKLHADERALREQYERDLLKLRRDAYLSHWEILNDDQDIVLDRLIGGEFEAGFVR